MTLLLPLVRRNREPTRVCIVAPSLDILGGQAVQAARLLEHLRTLPGLHVDLLTVTTIGRTNGHRSFRGRPNRSATRRARLRR